MVRLCVLKFLPRTGAQVPERGVPGPKNRRKSKTAENCQNEGGNGLQSNGSCGC